jgi:hypothetical protein
VCPAQILVGFHTKAGGVGACRSSSGHYAVLTNEAMLNCAL